MISPNTDTTFHYPPDLFNLLVDVIPLLNRSKKDVLLFFQGAGVAKESMSDLATRVRIAPDKINKYEIVRTVLERINAKGEVSLRDRREVLRRVVEFSNFDTCWPDDRFKAKGLIAAIREIVDQKDAFTRMKQERDQEHKLRRAQAEREIKKRQEKIGKIDMAKKEFYDLFGAQLTPQNRRKKLETALNNLFSAYEILIQEAFHLTGDDGEGVVEQVDGVVELKGSLYFVEMKWYQNSVGKAEISEHLVRLISRAEARGIFISASSYTEPAIQTSREFLHHKVFVLVTLQEIVYLLEQQGDLAQFLNKKVESAILHKNPFVEIDIKLGSPE